MELQTLRDLLEHTLQDTLSAEEQIIEALPAMIEKASHARLRQAFETHLAQSQEQLERLEQVAEMLDMDTDGETCRAMQGLVEEAESFMAEDLSPEVCDAGMIAMAQKIEHYEIAAYGTMAIWAEQLGESEAASLFRQTLEEERETDQLLTQIAESGVNQDAETA